ncbi:hypothetical protein GCM10009759_25200 [Kitasatospora saccharophila]|uniref:Uncharacterized protein n=1 Tax=Kitasatospora saccharophila TaxID=407973 RepID=A0ABN2WPL8_9ACTN
MNGTGDTGDTGEDVPEGWSPPQQPVPGQPVPSGPVPGRPLPPDPPAPLPPPTQATPPSRESCPGCGGSWSHFHGCALTVLSVEEASVLGLRKAERRVRQVLEERRRIAESSATPYPGAPLPSGPRPGAGPYDEAGYPSTARPRWWRRLFNFRRGPSAP